MLTNVVWAGLRSGQKNGGLSFASVKALNAALVAKPERSAKHVAGLALVAAFDEAAQAWGYQSDQGIGKSVGMAEAEYNQAYAKLVSFILCNVK